MVEDRLSREAAEFRIHHEGPGFDGSQLQMNVDLLSSTSHLIRGWFLMRSIMDEVQISADGRSQTLIKRAIPETDLLVDE